MPLHTLIRPSTPLKDPQTKEIWGRWWLFHWHNPYLHFKVPESSSNGAKFSIWSAPAPKKDYQHQLDTLHGLQQRSPVWTRPERCCAWWGYPLEVPQLKIMCCSNLFHLRICSTMAITQTDFMINDTYAENTQNRQVILHMTPDVVARCLYRSTCACWPWCGPLQLTLQTCAGWKCRFGRPQDSHTIVYLDIHIYI